MGTQPRPAGLAQCLGDVSGGDSHLALMSCRRLEISFCLGWEDEAACGRGACSCPHPGMEELFPELLAIE